MIHYWVHTYQHASGHKQKTRRSVYLPEDRDLASKNLEVLGGKLEAVTVGISIRKSTKR